MTKGTCGCKILKGITERIAKTYNLSVDDFLHLQALAEAGKIIKIVSDNSDVYIDNSGILLSLTKERDLYDSLLLQQETAKIIEQHQVNTPKIFACGSTLLDGFNTRTVICQEYISGAQPLRDRNDNPYTIEQLQRTIGLKIETIKKYFIDAGNLIWNSFNLDLFYPGNNILYKDGNLYFIDLHFEDRNFRDRPQIVFYDLIQALTGQSGIIGYNWTCEQKKLFEKACEHVGHAVFEVYQQDPKANRFLKEGAELAHITQYVK